jgi:von Willebrand factor type A domain-containing protein
MMNAQPVASAAVSDDVKRRLVQLLVDESGSMEKTKDDAEGGLIAFLNEQVPVPGRTTISLSKFNSRCSETFRSRGLAAVLADVDSVRLRPRGSTALLDAVGMTIAALSEYIAGLSEDKRPDEVVVVIVTDGKENASREYDRGAVAAAVNRKETDDGWVFVFLGANQDAFAEAHHIGIGPNTVMPYSSDTTNTSIETAGRMVARGSLSGRYSFTDEERDANAGDSAAVDADNSSARERG